MPSVRKLCAGKRKKYSNGCFATRTLTDRDSAAMQVNNKPATEEFHLRHLDVVEENGHEVAERASQPFLISVKKGQMIRYPRLQYDVPVAGQLLDRREHTVQQRRYIHRHAFQRSAIGSRIGRLAKLGP